MEPQSNKDMDREAQRAAEVQKLRQFEQDAVRSGAKLGPRDRLKAAFHLTRAWNRANRAGLRKASFQEGVFARLQRSHKRRQEFRLTNWTLRRGEDPFQQDLTALYEGSREPYKALEQYLVGIAVAAEHCEVEPDDWKLDMMRDLSIWSRPTEGPGVALQDDRPAETLAILLNALCVNLARKNQLDAILDAVRQMSCRWEMFEERLIPVTDDTICMESIDSPISPISEESLYFEEMFPFPSVPLLYVPHLVGDTEFALAPEAMLRQDDAKRMAEGDYQQVGAAMGPPHGEHYDVPEDMPGLHKMKGKLIWSRELRLCIVPDGHGGFAPSIESRPRVEVEFPQDSPCEGRHHVVGGYEPDLERGLFYARSKDGGPFWPHIHDRDGVSWRVRLALENDNDNWFDGFVERDPETTGWCFDPDPIRHPGEWSSEPWYLSYTPATAPYLRHWLTKDWRLGHEPGVCPWNRSNFDVDNPESNWNRKFPPIHELNFPDFSFATWIECCLHNGLIEEALQAAIDRLKDQVGTLQAEWHNARERHSNALLVHWQTDEKKRD